ncbi:unnamed protein product [Linum tenue]|uniref:non-specific serine/threonine protein kinase n=1 Tax=Linum tenue TaxID=586396 RepID=A0AAV0LZP5_9ROSI|nr:unnamed protein product [Linum tenue]
MKLGLDRRTGFDRYLTSSKAADDPSSGGFTYRIDPRGYPEIIQREGSTERYRTGPWNGLRPNPIYTYEFVYNSDQIFYRFDLADKSVISRMVLDNEGILQRFTWTASSRTWNLYLTAQMDNCDRYGLCGPYGSCNINNSPPCGCLIGFEPRSRRDWDSGDWAGGCVRRNDSVCGVGEGFQRIVSVKLPDTNTSSYNSSMDLGECEATCLRDCSCTAYSALNVSDGSGCLLWFGDLVDVRHYTEDGQDFFIRLAASDLGRKLGEGGFGPVYKGVFKDGQEMAVKRLSKDSTQGLDEFKNEVKTIAKLQHRNLVKLLGCCIEKEEKVLIYEYMPNKGLDAFIFDQKQRKLLDWPMRFQIINGIARGLLYLHQDSRLRIIHRDLKASNVLLDYNMNPKISDFGMARIFGGNQTQGNTRRVVGTYGYMSPEYAIDGQFSIKSDVFSYGVLVLEIICGKRNRGFYHEDHNHNLLGHAWRLYKEGKPEEVMDETVKDSSWVLSEVVRCIHVALLCVQQGPEDRPNMSNVVLMLSSDILLPEPTEPGFFTERKVFEQESSTNEITITLLTAR